MAGRPPADVIEVLEFGRMMIAKVVDEQGRTRHYLTAIDIDFNRTLLSEAIVGELTGDEDRLDPDHFTPNLAFLKFLHWVLARHGASSPGFIAEAARQKDGYVYIIDNRTSTPDGSVPPEDIIGAFEIADGKPLRYIGSPQYAPLTGQGPPQLGPWLQARLVDELNVLSGH